MAISDRLNSIKTHVGNAYAGEYNRGGTIPTKKNIENLKAAIESIAVQKPEQEKTVNVTENGSVIILPDEGKVLTKATAVVDVQPSLQAKTVTPTNTQQVVKPDSAYYGLSQVTVAAAPTETATVTPTKSTQTKTPSSGKVGFSQVTVNPIPDDYIIPSGARESTANGTYDVTDKASVVVGVSSEKPTLNAPTISLNGSTLSMTNPETNGNFASSFKVYDGSILLKTLFFPEGVIQKTVDLSTLITSAGNHTITVKTSGTNFNDSTASNTVTYRVLSTPTISLVSGTTIQIDTIDDNATTIEVFADGLSIGEVQKQ